MFTSKANILHLSQIIMKTISATDVPSIENDQQPSREHFVCFHVDAVSTCASDSPTFPFKLIPVDCLSTALQLRVMPGMKMYALESKNMKYMDEPFSL